MKDESQGSDIDLAGKSLSNLSVLKKYDRAKYKSLNLHNNMLNDISDLPRFLFLSELNLSSNRFKYVPDLSFLPALTSLDVSGNMIESLISLPFLPALKTLKLAYNCVKSLHGLTSANVPCLEYLDLRENPIIATEYEIKPIGTLYHLKDIAIQTNKIATIALLFTTCSSLQSVDRKSQAAWKDFASKQLKAEAPPVPPSVPPALEVQISTPHFDKVAAKYRSAPISAPAAHSMNPWQNVGTAGPSPVNKKPAAATVSSPAQSPYRSVGTTPTRANPKPSSPSYIPQYVHHTPPETLDESTQMTVVSESSDNTHSEQLRLLALQRIVLSADQHAQMARVSRLARALRLFKENALKVSHNESTKRQQQAHTHETANLTSELARLTQESTQAQLHFASAFKQQQEDGQQRILQLEALFAATKEDLENEREKYGNARLTNGQLQHTLESTHEATQRQLEDQEIKLRALEGAEQRAKEQHDITLRELEGALSESSATIEKLRFELAYCRERLAQSDDRMGSAQQAVASAQHEKAEYYARALALEKQLALEKEDFQSQIKEFQTEKQELTASLAVAQQDLSALHAEGQNVTAQREKAEQRLRQLHTAFESLKNELAEHKQENITLKERDTKNVAALKEVTRGARKLQEIIEMRKNNCEKCTDLEKQLRDVRREREEDLRVCEKVKISLQSSVDQNAQLQSEHRAKVAQLTEATTQVTSLQTQVHTLQSRLMKETSKLASPPPKSPAPASLVDTERLSKLETALKVKEAMLNDQATELTELRHTLQEQGSEFKACRRDYGDLEERYEHCKRDLRELDAECAELKVELRHLRQELARRSNSEVQLKALISEFQDADPLNPISKQLFTSGTSGDLQSHHSVSTSEHTSHTAHTHDHTIPIHPGRKTVCVNSQCVQEKERLMHDLEHTVSELREQKEQHERLYRVKNEECAKFAQAVTQLEVNSANLAGDIRAEKEKFEATIEKYRSEKKKLQRQCQKLEEELKLKEGELARTQSAADQLQGAIANFQKLGSTAK